MEDSLLGMLQPVFQHRWGKNKDTCLSVYRSLASNAFIQSSLIYNPLHDYALSEQLLSNDVYPLILYYSLTYAHQVARPMRNISWLLWNWVSFDEGMLSLGK